MVSVDPVAIRFLQPKKARKVVDKEAEDPEAKAAEEVAEEAWARLAEYHKHH